MEQKLDIDEFMQELATRKALKPSKSPAKAVEASKAPASTPEPLSGLKEAVEESLDIKALRAKIATLEGLLVAISDPDMQCRYKGELAQVRTILQRELGGPLNAS